MKMTMTVELDNDAMQEVRPPGQPPAGSATAVLASLVLSMQHWSCLEPGDQGRMSDANGNRVGRWEVDA